MKRFIYKTEGESSKFSWLKTVQSLLLGALVTTAIGWVLWVTDCSRKKEATEKQVASLSAKIDKQYEVLHMRITKEQETRTDEFEGLVSKQLEIFKEQNRILVEQNKILYTLAKKKGD